MKKKRHTQSWVKSLFKLPIAGAFFAMVTFTILAYGTLLVLFSVTETVTYKIIGVFLVLIVASNFYAKKCIIIFTQYE